MPNQALLDVTHIGEEVAYCSDLWAEQRGRDPPDSPYSGAPESQCGPYSTTVSPRCLAEPGVGVGVLSDSTTPLFLRTPAAAGCYRAASETQTLAVPILPAIKTAERGVRKWPG